MGRIARRLKYNFCLFDRGPFIKQVLKSC